MKDSALMRLNPDENHHFVVKSKKFLDKSQDRGALNPKSVLCTYQAPSAAFCALNPGSARIPRILNPGITVLAPIL